MTEEQNQEMFRAIAQNDFYGLRKLLNEDGCDINVTNEYGDTLLRVAIGNGGADRTDIIQLLLARNINFNAQDERGNTALHAAMSREQFWVVYILVDAGADCNIKNKYGETVLDLIDKHPLTQISKKLIERLKCLKKEGEKG